MPSLGGEHGGLPEAGDRRGGEELTEGEPGYCIACGDFHLLTSVPEWGGSACDWCIATRRLDPPEPGPGHVCNTSAWHKPDRPEYRRCSCGQWLWAGSGAGYWYRVDRPPRHWLREHGLDPEEFWGIDEDEGPGLFGEAGCGRPPLRVFLSRSFLRWLSGRA